MHCGKVMIRRSGSQTVATGAPAAEGHPPAHRHKSTVDMSPSASKLRGKPRPSDLYDIPSKHRLVLIADWESRWDERREEWVETPGSLTVKDTASDAVAFQPPAQFARPIKAGWGGRYLVAAYGIDGEVLILDFAHMVTQ